MYYTHIFIIIIIIVVVAGVIYSLTFLHVAQKAKSGGTEGAYTKERGFLAYYEVCKRATSGQWKMNTDSVGGPYMTSGNQWIGWDDVQYINLKARLINIHQLFHMN